MTTLTVRMTGVCSGGNHLTFSITGDKTATVPVDLSDLSEQIRQEDLAAFCKVVARMAKLGRTVAQAKTMLLTGVTVTV